MVDDIKKKMWGSYLSSNGETDLHTNSGLPKILVLDSKETISGEDYYTELKDHIIHYLSAYNVDFKINRYADTTWKYLWQDQIQVDRYVVDFYLDGKKLKVEDRKKIYLSEEDPRAYFIIDDERDRLHFYIIEDYGRTRKEWYVNWKVGNYFTLECDYFDATKRVTIAHDKYGNIEIYLDENAQNLCTFSERKTGKKYCINIGGNKPTVDECIERMVSLIDQEKNTPEEARMFELMIRDPRLEKWLESCLRIMPKSIDETFNKLKKGIDDEFEKIRQEYEEKSKSLKEEILRSQKGRELIPSTDKVKGKRR